MIYDNETWLAHESASSCFQHSPFLLSGCFIYPPPLTGEEYERINFDKCDLCTKYISILIDINVQSLSILE